MELVAVVRTVRHDVVNSAKEMRSMAAPVTLTECVASSSGLRILIALPAPLNDPARLSPETELSTVYGALDDLRVEVTLIRLYPPTVDALTTALSLNVFDIIHVAGHASAERIELETETGVVHAVPHEEFAELFVGHKPCVLILTGCATESLADISASMARQVTTIATAGNMPRVDGQQVLAGIYRRLLAGQTPERIAQEATNALARRPGPAGDTAIVARGPQTSETFVSLQVGVARPAYYDCRPVTNIRQHQHASRLFGREEELVGLSDWMAGKGSENHHLGVVGITGTGKTTLVAAAARRYGWHFPDGVLYFSATDGFSAEQLADALDWDLEDVPQTDLITEVATRLSRGRYLLVFDDANEYGVASSEAMHGLLRRWRPDLGSRAVLICHSRSHALTPLLGTNWLPVSDLPPVAAADLLESLLGGPDAVAAIAGIDLGEAARMCFFHPRTISSVAALLSMGQSYRDLKRHLATLDGNGPLAVNTEILQKVIAAVEQRVPATRDVLGCLMVLSKSCRMSTWRQVAARGMGGRSSTSMSIDQAFNELQSARLIERETASDDPLCTVHPLVMAHVRAHNSITKPKMRRLVDAHVDAQIAISGEDRAYPRGEIAAIQRALEVAVDLDMHHSIVRFCTAVIGSSRSPIVRGGPWQFGRELLAIGGEAARQNGDTDSLSRFAAVRGAIEYRLTQFDAALAAYSEAWELANSAGAFDLQFEALKGQGQVQYRIGRFGEAEIVYVRARALAADIDERAIADIDHQLAKVHYRRGEFDAARAALESAWRVREAAGDRPRDVAKTIHELGRVEHACGDLNRARSLYLEALRIEREITDVVTEQATLFQLGRLAIDMGDLDTAAQYLAESKRLSQELGDPLWLVHAEFGDAFLAQARGDVDARALGEVALADARKLRIGLADEIAAWLADLDSR